MNIDGSCNMSEFSQFLILNSRIIRQKRKKFDANMDHGGDHGGNTSMYGLTKLQFNLVSILFCASLNKSSCIMFESKVQQSM